uniref:Gap junction beta-2 protein-like n=1 Tax=Geotrypetes seraphini TaxID=260995 RepID=A0A6P8S6M4_GEOSA|nr:gap junction beta-2 protein-like [Geotrypetes seraphini]XP_033812654.1 gap junction beta-2 protein-like [Geotrypetes seraphini]XP_033812655.1 gap junction beta-2 protein-like [Geotrypetes seraphini]
MDIETITCLLSGMSIQASRLGRTCLALFFFTRLGFLVVGAKTLYKNEEGDFVCNSSLQSCSSVCFNSYSPISPFNLFTLQVVVLFTHALTVASHFRHNSQAKSTWLQSRLRSRLGLDKQHFLSILAKAMIEGIFVVTFYKIFDALQRPAAIQCDAIPCENLITCTVQKAGAKNGFNLCMNIMALACLFVCLNELYLTGLKIYSKTSTLEKMHPTTKVYV